jgi:hypothetical protein
MKSLKLIVFTIVFTFFGFSVVAQEISLGLRGGLNLPNITGGGKDTPLSEGYSSRMAAGGGIFGEYQFNPQWSVRIGVEYSGQGGKKNGIQAMPADKLIGTMMSSFNPEVLLSLLSAMPQLQSLMPEYVYADVNNTVKFNYLMIPLLAQYTHHFGNSAWSAHINAGPFLSFLLSGEQITKGASFLYTDKTGKAKLSEALMAGIAQNPALADALAQFAPQIVGALNQEIDFGQTRDITDELKKTNFGIVGNLGVNYQFGKNRLSLEGGGNYGFITVQKDDINGSNRIGSASVMLGFARAIN